VNANNYTVLDSDLPGSVYEYVANDNTDTAQAIVSPSVIAGHLGQVTVGGTTTNDTLDIYQITLNNNMVANLEVSDYDASNNIGLYLYNADGSFNTSVTSASATKSLTLPSSGTYFIVPRILSGESKYILDIGQTASVSSFHTHANDDPQVIMRRMK
jgi:hypothetical protein